MSNNQSAAPAEYAAFDASDYLDNENVIAEYLSAAAEDPNSDVLLQALFDVAKARGMAKVARDAGLGRESLYKALSPGRHPRHETISAVMHAMGLKFAVVPVCPVALPVHAKSIAKRGVVVRRTRTRRKAA